MTATGATRRTVEPVSNRDQPAAGAHPWVPPPRRGDAGPPHPQRPGCSPGPPVTIAVAVATLVRIHQHQHGPYGVRAVGFLGGLVGLTLSIWTPLLLAGGPHPSGIAIVAGVAAAAYFIGLAINAGVLYRLGRGDPPPLQSSVEPPLLLRTTPRLGRLILLPGALAVRHHQQHHRQAAVAAPAPAPGPRHEEEPRTPAITPRSTPPAEHAFGGACDGQHPGR